MLPAVGAVVLAVALMSNPGAALCLPRPIALVLLVMWGRQPGHPAVGARIDQIQQLGALVPVVFSSRDTAAGLTQNLPSIQLSVGTQLTGSLGAANGIVQLLLMSCWPC